MFESTANYTTLHPWLLASWLTLLSNSRVMNIHYLRYIAVITHVSFSRNNERELLCISAPRMRWYVSTAHMTGRRSLSFFSLTSTVLERQFLCISVSTGHMTGRRSFTFFSLTPTVLERPLKLKWHKYNFAIKV